MASQVVIFERVTQSFRCRTCGERFEIPSRVYRNPEAFCCMHETLERLHGACATPDQAAYQAFVALGDPALLLANRPWLRSFDGRAAIQ